MRAERKEISQGCLLAFLLDQCEIIVDSTFLRELVTSKSYIKTVFLIKLKT